MLLFLFPLPLQANQHYSALIVDIEARLDNTLALYKQQKIDEARTEVQMAYFEVFENLEGPIRINFSAQKSYQMESRFGEIRKMISQQQPISLIQQKIIDLKQDLQMVLPALETGHKVIAEGQHGAYDNENILPYWQQNFRHIDDLLAQAVSAYEQQQFEQVKKLVQQAQFEGYKNSEMEIAIRQNRSASASSAINQQFNQLIRLTEQTEPIAVFGYHITMLLQDIEEQLPDLPTTRESQQPSLANHSNNTDDNNEQDWQQIRQQIIDDIQIAIALYQQGESKKAMLAIQDSYFDVFENSGMENKIGARDSHFKAQLEGYFTRLVGLIKNGADSEKLQQQANTLAQELEQAVTMLQTKQDSHWSMFLYSLLIIVREGLEALLIVAAITTYLIKNHHQDKLTVIRQSVYVALIASLITAVLFHFMFDNAGASRELLEGFTMMIAVIMLFSMSYWLLSKVETKNWKRYLEGKLSTALTTGSLIGLWFTSFLAVYREGAETVLFYYALIADVNDMLSYIYLLAGFIVGIILLIICYIIMRYTVIKLPLKPFFIFTGGFMYFMAFVFAGKSVLELIEGKLFEPTLLQGMPEISWLGIYPYLETLIPQFFLILAAIFALLYMKYQSKNIS
ncbi:iron permease [Volucribacter amazonae]|uniref:Iron permease n=1 Tax=Volucribacter amazonae TaxID=256731 RepID=A0A9X4PC43_9PAST|nr:iron permease [Volucribacter amazonae]